MGPFFGGQFFSGGFFGSLVGGGNDKKKKRRRILRRSEFTEEEFKEQFQALTSEIEVKPFQIEEPDLEDEDDALLLKVLALTIH